MRLPFFTMFLLSSMLMYAQPTKKYLMSFHTCTDCAMPTNHTVQLAESDNGSSWSLVPGHTGWQGSVPDVITRGSKIYLYAPTGMKTYDSSTKAWSNTSKFSVVDKNGATVNIVDPSAHINANGKIVLFYLVSTGSTGDPASCTSYPCTKNFGSAIEKEGTDGTQFVAVDGYRASITLNNGSASDPDIFYDGSKYWLYISLGQSVEVRSSDLLHGDYQKVTTLSNSILTSQGGIPAGYYDPTSKKYWTYVHSGGPSLIKLGITDNVTTALTSVNSVITGSIIGNSAASVASPGFAINTLNAAFKDAKGSGTDSAVGTTSGGSGGTGGTGGSGGTGGTGGSGGSTTTLDSLPNAPEAKTWTGRFGFKYSFVSKTIFEGGLDNEPNHRVKIENIGSTKKVNVSMSYTGINADSTVPKLSGGGFAWFPNGGYINLKPGDTTVVQGWSSGWRECSCTQTGINNKLVRFIFSYDSTYYGPDGEPDGRITLSDTIYQPIKLVLRAQSDLSKIAVLQTGAKTQTIKGAFIVPGYILSSTKLESVSINTNESTVSIFPSTAGYISEKDTLGNRYIMFNITVNARNDYRIQANFSSTNTSLYVPSANIVVPDDQSVNNLTATVLPYGKASFTTDSVTMFESATGYWRTVFSAGDSSITVFPGQENWMGNTAAEKNTKRFLSKIVKFSVASSTYGKKLWESAIPFESWGGGASKDGKVIAYMINQRGFEGNLQDDPNVDWVGIIDGTTGKKLYGLRGNMAALEGLEITVSNSGQYFATGSTGQGLLTMFKHNGTSATQLWSNTPDDKLDIATHLGQIRKIVFSEDDKYVYAGSGDMYLRKFEVATGKLLWKAYIGGWPFVNGIAIANGYIITGTKSKDRTLVRDSDGKVIYFAGTFGFDAHADSAFNGPVVGFGNMVTDNKSGRAIAKVGGNAVKQTILGGDFVVAIDKYLEVYSRYGGNTLAVRTTYLGTGPGENCQSGWISPSGDRVVVTARDLTTPGQPDIRKTVGFFRLSRSINKFPTLDSVSSKTLGIGDSLRFKVTYSDFADYNVANTDLKLTVTADTSSIKTIVRGDSVIVYSTGFTGNSNLNISIAENSTAEKFVVSQKVPIKITCTEPSAPSVSTTSLNYCKGETSAALAATAPSGASLKWYTAASGGTSSSTAPVPSTAAAGTSTYYVSSNLAGCESSSRVSISVTVNDVPSKPTVSGVANICTGETVTLSSSASSGNAWYLNGTLLTDSTRDKLAVKATGSYNVKVIANGCSSPLSDTAKITVNAIPAKPVISGASVVCSGSSLTLGSSATTGNQWYLNGTVIKDSTRDKLVIAAAGSYTVKSTVNNCASPLSDATAVSVVTTPSKPTVTRDANGNLVSSASTGNQWYKETTAITGATNASFKPTEAGNYNVKVSVSGCSSTSSDNYYYLSTAVFNTGLSKGIKLYPNPVSSHLNIEFDRSAASRVSIFIYDMNGREVMKRNNVLSGAEFNLTRFGKGAYTIKIVDGNGRLISQQKLVKN